MTVINNEIKTQQFTKGQTHVEVKVYKKAQMTIQRDCQVSEK